MAGLTSVRTAVHTARAYARLARIGLTPPRPRPRDARHLLLLAWDFPPSTGGGVYRVAALARRAVQQGWRVTVACGPGPATPSSAGRYLEQYVGDDVEIMRLEPSPLEPAYNFSPRISGGFLNALDTVQRLTARFADAAPTWIVASGPPFHNFVAARELSRIIHAPYVLDYRDEWTLCPFQFAQLGNADAFFEERCLRDAHRVIFTTDAMRELAVQHFRGLKQEKTAVVYNGWEPEHTSDASRTRAPLPAADIRLAFVGTLGEHTLPTRFLSHLAGALEAHDALRRRFRLTFLGRTSQEAKVLLDTFPHRDVLEVLDERPKPEALACMRDADALLMINEPRLSRYRPGKLYDYISMKTPVLVFGRGGEVDRVVSELGAGITVPDNDAALLASAIGQLPALRRTLDHERIDRWLAAHTRAQVASAFLELLA